MRPKFEYVATLLVPLGAPAARRAPGADDVVYGAIFCLLASKPAVYSIAFQYSTLFLPLGVRDGRHRPGAGPALAHRRGARTRRARNCAARSSRSR